MATDATGTPTTALGIPKYNTAQDIPSGKGFNAAMDVIDDLIEARGTNVPGASGVKVWNNTTKSWENPSGAPDGTKFLRDDGAWGAPSGKELAYAQITAEVTGITTSSAATATNIVSAGAVTFDGSAVMVEFYTPQAESPAVADGRILFELYDGGSAVMTIGALGSETAAAQKACVLVRVRFTPSAAAHTYSVRAWVSSGTGSVRAGAGGAGVLVPAYIRITKA